MIRALIKLTLAVASCCGYIGCAPNQGTESVLDHELTQSGPAAQPPAPVSEKPRPEFPQEPPGS